MLIFLDLPPHYSLSFLPHVPSAPFPCDSLQVVQILLYASDIGLSLESDASSHL